MQGRIFSIALFAMLSIACESERSPSQPTRPNRDGGAVGGDAGSADAAASIDAMVPPPEACMPSTAPCGSIPPTQNLSEPCCLSLGIDACGANLFCAAFDDRTLATCYAEGSRADGTECCASSHCTSGSCNTSLARCRAAAGTTCDPNIGCAPGLDGTPYLCMNTCLRADGTPGAPCLEPAQCASGFCVQNRCSTGAPGETCNGDGDCASGLCVEQRCAGGPRCDTPASVSCIAQQIQELQLFDNVSTGEVRAESVTGGVYTTYVDARGGGLTPTQSFVYAKFTQEGLVRVDISDERAFESMDWDIAFRRFTIRVNSGVSGPSCTRVARGPNGADFDSVTTKPENLTFRAEDYFTPACELVPDGSGLPGAIAVALGSYSTYSSCLQMTNNVFVLELADGLDVKLQIERYYGEPGAQDACDATGMVPMPSGSAQFTFKWAYLR